MQRLYKSFVLLAVFIISVNRLLPASSYVHEGQVVDLIVFSYDRAMQLHAFLTSLTKQVQGLGRCVVIYRSSSTEHDRAYDIVKAQFKEMIFQKQHAPKQGDFTPMVCNALTNGTSAYCMFAVDDDVVINPVDMRVCSAWLDKTGYHGFYLRLGLHTRHCYSLRCAVKRPLLRCETEKMYGDVVNDIYSWSFMGQSGDWGYPGSVEMTVWRKKDLMHFLEGQQFTNPNKLEEILNYRMRHAQKGLCFDRASVVSIPLNIVNETHTHNRQMHGVSSAQLLHQFLDGYAFDITPLYGSRPVAPHIDYVPKLTRRA